MVLSTTGSSQALLRSSTNSTLILFSLQSGEVVQTWQEADLNTELGLAADTSWSEVFDSCCPAVSQLLLHTKPVSIKIGTSPRQFDSSMSQPGQYSVTDQLYGHQVCGSTLTVNVLAGLEQVEPGNENGGIIDEYGDKKEIRSRIIQLDGAHSCSDSEDDVMKTFLCQYCNKSFANSSNLRKHIQQTCKLRPVVQSELGKRKQNIECKTYHINKNLEPYFDTCDNNFAKFMCCENEQYPLAINNFWPCLFDYRDKTKYETLIGDVCTHNCYEVLSSILTDAHNHYNVHEITFSSHSLVEKEGQLLDISLYRIPKFWQNVVKKKRPTFRVEVKEGLVSVSFSTDYLNFLREPLYLKQATEDEENTDTSVDIESPILELSQQLSHVSLDQDSDIEFERPIKRARIPMLNKLSIKNKVSSVNKSVNKPSEASFPPLPSVRLRTCHSRHSTHENIDTTAVVELDKTSLDRTDTAADTTECVIDGNTAPQYTTGASVEYEAANIGRNEAVDTGVDTGVEYGAGGSDTGGYGAGYTAGHGAGDTGGYGAGVTARYGAGDTGHGAVSTHKGGGGDIADHGSCVIAVGVDSVIQIASAASIHGDGDTSFESSLPSVRRKTITCPLCGTELIGGQGSLTRHQRNSCSAKQNADIPFVRKRRSKSIEVALQLDQTVAGPLDAPAALHCARPGRPAPRHVAREPPGRIKDFL
jgi:hypothetical protein